MAPGLWGSDKHDTYDDFRKAAGCYRQMHDPSWYGMEGYSEKDFVEDKLDSSVFGAMSKHHMEGGRHLSIIAAENLALIMSAFRSTGYDTTDFRHLWHKVSRWLSRWLRHAKHRSEPPHYEGYAITTAMDTGGWVEVKQLMACADKYCEPWQKMSPNVYALRGLRGHSGSAGQPAQPHKNSLEDKKKYLFKACLARAAMESGAEHGERRRGSPWRLARRSRWRQVLRAKYCSRGTVQAHSLSSLSGQGKATPLTLLIWSA